MFPNMRWVAWLFVLAILQGCATATNVVYDNEDRRTGAAKAPYGVSMYLDRDGSLYPPPSVEMNGSFFTESKASTATLLSYFQQPSAQEEWRTLLSSVGLVQRGTVEDRWNEVQAQLIKRVAASIAEGSGNGRRSIVFVVHGYNNQFIDSQKWYEQVEADIARRIRAHREHDPFFVRVHWDGLSQVIPVNIWTRAQWNGPLTGLTLRKVLKELDGQLESDLPLVMLSHSTGALVVANAVGDGSAALDCGDNFKVHCPAVQDKSTLPRLVSKVRLGLLIPAASLDTFNNFRESAVSPQAVVLGLNHRDFPTNKVLGCRWLGSTCLNVWTVNACHQLRSAFAVGGGTETALFEFSNSPQNQGKTALFWESHAVEDQMRRGRWGAFIDRLLFPQSAVSDDSNAYCK